MPTDTETRLGELALYIATRCKDDPQFGKTKLVKLLAFADFRAYERLGKSLTDAHYVKLEFGPGPRELPATLSLLRARGRLQLEQENTFDYEQTRVVACEDGDLEGLFSAEQRSIVDEVLDRFAAWGNAEMSEFSHRQFVGWKIVGEMEEIPFHTVYLSPRPAQEADYEQGRGIAIELGIAS